MILQPSRPHNPTQGLGGRLARHMIKAEAAIWKEAFDPAEGMVYEAPDDPATYPPGGGSEDDLRRHSWRFWFRQPDGSALDAFSGVINSFNQTDEALMRWKRRNDWTFRKNPGDKHYYRRLVGLPPLGPIMSNPRWRTTADSVLYEGNEHQLDQEPALMRPGQRRSTFLGFFRILAYGRTDLNEPIGAVPGPGAFSRMFDATDEEQGFGWRERRHSDGWVIEGAVSSGDDNRMWFPKVYNWWHDVIGGHAHRGVE